MRDTEIEMFAHEGTVEDFAASLEPGRLDGVRVLADRIRSSRLIRNIVVCTFVATPFVAAGFVVASQEPSEEPVHSDATVTSSTIVSQQQQQCYNQAQARFESDIERNITKFMGELELCEQQEVLGVNGL